MSTCNKQLPVVRLTFIEYCIQALAVTSQQAPVSHICSKPVQAKRAAEVAHHTRGSWQRAQLTLVAVHLQIQDMQRQHEMRLQQAQPTPMAQIASTARSALSCFINAHIRQFTAI